MEQYFAKNPECESNPVACSFPFAGCGISCMTDSGVFSRGELDEGTALLLSALPALSGNILDVGCGWGAIGVAVAKAYPSCRVTMVDVNERALSLARQNVLINGTSAEVMESDGLKEVMDRQFDYIITNPPIRAGKQVVYGMFSDSARCLAQDGELYLVIRKQQGGDSAIKFLKTLFSSVEKIARSGGFWVIRAGKPVEQ